MAIIKIGQIRSTLRAAISYVVAPEKTREGIMTSSNCAVPWDPDAIAMVMEGTAEDAARVKTVGAPGTVLAYHIVQSLKPGETDPNTAHRLGVEFVEEITGGQYEYVIATHTDRDHIHNHIIFNAVNQQTLKKYRCPKTRVYEYRSISDRLCRAHGLSVIEQPHPARRIQIGEAYARADGRSAKAAIAEKIDAAVTVSTTWQEMLDRLAADDVSVYARGAHVLFRDASMTGRGVRGATLGAAYTEANLRARLGRSDVCEYVIQRRLVTMLDENRAQIRLPGRRDRFIVVQRAHVADHGKTYRVFLPSATTVTLTDATGRLAGERTPDGLYEFFTRPEALRSRLAGLAETARGKTAAQRRYYAHIDRQVAQLHAEADVVNIRAAYAAADDKPGFLAALRANIEQTSREETRLVLAKQKAFDAKADASTVGRDLEAATRRLAALRAAHIQLSRTAKQEKEMKR